MTQAFDIRRLGPSDLAAIRQMNALFAEVFGEPDKYLDEPPGDVWLQERLARPHIVPLVAVADAAVIGALVAYELDKFEQARRELYIYDLAVAAPHRRRGVASALIARLREIAAERGVRVIYVQADYGDDPAVALYSKLGVREDVMHFDIPV